MNQSIIIYHILVKHEYEAQDILKKITEGLQFSEAAKKFSNCQSAKEGGYLGAYKPRRFVEAFDEALGDLKLNEISKPVRTQFGYHLIIKKSQ